MKRRQFTLMLAGAGVALATGLGAGTFAMGMPAATEDRITVYKSPQCGCCSDWVEHLRENGFAVDVHNTDTINAVKEKAGLTPALASCHTAFVGDYVIEGHVPARDIRRLLAEAGPARGLTVPGMPVGSPGMEMGDRQDPFQVLAFNAAGQTRVFAEYP